MKILSTILMLMLAVTPGWAAEDEPMRARDLPKVLIIGDSISIGYTPFVNEMLKGEAAITHNRGNAQHTAFALTNLNAWIGKTKWDVIHFNWGLHDLCYKNPQSKNPNQRDKVNGKILVPIDQYERNLETLVTRLEQTGAKLIWASTTLVPEGEDGRFVGDDLKYNAIAERVMKKHGIRINDLHALSGKFPPELFTAPGNVHYTPEGYRKLAAQVVEEIRTVMKDSAGK